MDKHKTLAPQSDWGGKFDKEFGVNLWRHSWVDFGEEELIKFLLVDFPRILMVIFFIFSLDLFFICLGGFIIWELQWHFPPSYD